MSLVIAMIDQGRMHVCADLRIVKSEILAEDQQRHTPDYFNGVLKIIPISPSIAICYAGTVPTALDVIRAVKDSRCSSSVMPGLIVNKLIEGNNLNECDFLVLDAAELTIRKIQDGEITTLSNGTTWIGDSDAYNLFKAKLDESGYSEDKNPISKSAKFMNSLQSVINDRHVSSVGEFPITAHNANGEIRLGVAFSAQGLSGSMGQGLNPVQFSTDTNDDSLIINLTVPVESGIAAIGIYITQARRGALYTPLDRDTPYLIDGNTIGEFRANVLDNCGIELLGGGFE